MYLVFGLHPTSELYYVLFLKGSVSCSYFTYFTWNPLLYLSPICVALTCGGRGPFYNLLIKSQTLSRPMSHGYDLHKCPMVWFFSPLFFLLPSLPIVFPICFLEALSHVDCVVGFSPPPLRWNRKEVTAGRTSFPPVGIRFESCALTVFSSGKEALVVEKTLGLFHNGSSPPTA